MYLCVCACACARACMHACMCMCACARACWRRWAMPGKRRKHFESVCPKRFIIRGQKHRAAVPSAAHTASPQTTLFLSPFTFPSLSLTLSKFIPLHWRHPPTSCAWGSFKTILGTILGCWFNFSNEMYIVY